MTNEEIDTNYGVKITLKNNDGKFEIIISDDSELKFKQVHAVLNKHELRRLISLAMGVFLNDK